MFPPFFPVCRNNCHAVTKAVAHRPVINKRHKFIKHPHCFFIVLLFCRAVTDQHTAQHGFFKISIVCAIFLSAGSRTPNSGLHSGIRLLEKLPYCASAIKSRRVLISCVIVSSFFQLLHHHIIFICIFIWKFHIKCTKMLL